MLMNRNRNGWLDVQRGETFHSAMRARCLGGDELKTESFVAIFSCVHCFYGEEDFCACTMWKIKREVFCKMMIEGEGV